MFTGCYYTGIGAATGMVVGAVAGRHANGFEGPAIFVVGTMMGAGAGAVADICVACADDEQKPSLKNR